MRVACASGGTEVMMFPHLPTLPATLVCSVFLKPVRQISFPVVSSNWETLFANQYNAACLPAMHLSVK